ncbi:MAG TPA: hypothetical protein VGF45_16325, partial [Polyangia bacterium]
MIRAQSSPPRNDAHLGTDAGPVLEALRLHDPGADLDLVRRCFDFAAERHAGQLRRSGDPY